MTVVSGHEREREVFGQTNQPLVCYSLFRDTVCLDFQVEISRLEYLSVLLSSPFCVLMLISDQKRGNFTFEATRKGYQSFAVAHQYFPVNAWLVIEPFDVAEGN